jgi:rhodanese-related sulfurtransferase
MFQVVVTALRRLGQAVLGVAVAACGQPEPSANGSGGPSAAYARLLHGLYRGTVATVRPAALAAELRQHPGTVLLLDTRAPAEFNVSHLAGAQFADFANYQTLALANVPRTQPVVVYCSVGARSEKVGERLHALGFVNVRNLYGGLFEWVNEGHPVVNAQGTTNQVHPYSALWGMWLKRGEKSYGTE